jgi:tight adherence protein B
MLLAAMPVAGLGLGFVVGTDPLGVLLHSPLGGACLIAAVVLQLAGVAWSTRLSRVEVPE